MKISKVSLLVWVIIGLIIGNFIFPNNSTPIFLIAVVVYVVLITRRKKQW